MFIKPCITFITAINRSYEHNTDELLSLIDMFVEYDRLQEAHDLCRTLMFKFSRASQLSLYFFIKPTDMIIIALQL